MTLNQEIEQADIRNLAFDPDENIFGTTLFKWQEIDTSIGTYIAILFNLLLIFYLLMTLYQ